MADVYRQLTAELTAASAKPGEAPKVEGADAKKQAEDLKTQAAAFKKILKARLDDFNRPQIAAETYTTLERLMGDLPIKDVTGSEEVKPEDEGLVSSLKDLAGFIAGLRKLEGAARDHFNSLVDMYERIDALSPEARGWFGGTAKLPEKQPVLDAAAELTKVVSMHKTYAEAHAAFKELRDEKGDEKGMNNTVGLIGFSRDLLVFQMTNFQDPDCQPIDSQTLLAAKTDSENKRKRFKATEEKTQQLLEHLNKAVDYTKSPAISAQDLATLKLLQPECLSTLAKVQELCAKQHQTLRENRAFTRNALNQMKARTEVLKGEESRLVELIRQEAPLGYFQSKWVYIVPHNVDKPIEALLGKAAAATGAAPTTPAAPPPAEVKQPAAATL